jgi:hypothetical protein
MQVTIFQSIKDTSTPFYREVDVILERIKSGKSREVINAIRKEKNKEERNRLKQKLPAICFSGTFNKRNDNSLIDHSGIICLDFDGYPSRKDMMSARNEIIADKYVYSCFISPSGDGLKVLVKIPKDSMNHKHYFNSLKDHFASEYFDVTSKNISRVCYESYDPLIHINNNSEIWTEIVQEVKSYSTDDVLLPKIRLTKTDEIIRRVLLWWEKKYGIVEGERNNNIYVLAAAFNRFGVSESMAKTECLRFQHEGFDRDEITNTVKSAYKKREEFDTEFFEDVEKYTEVRDRFKEGTPKKELRLDLRESGVDDETIDAVLTEVEKDLALPKFWNVSEKGVVSLLHYEFKEFLEDNGYYKYSPEGSKSYIFVKVVNNLIDDTSEEEMKDFILNYVKENAELNVYNFFAEKTKYFKEEFLNMLDPVDVYFVSDTKDTAYLYYRNCAVCVRKDNIETVDYIDLGGYVWKKQVIQRDFSVIDEVDCDYKQFVFNVSKGEEDRVKTLESTIGYCLHGFKNLGYCPAVVINDEVISNNPQGGTGKGIFVNAIGKMKNLVTLDGKTFSFEKSFPYQLISTDTQVLTFDDVKKKFDFERLFSVVTEGITVEKKNRDAFKIPFEASPKIIITTNYAIKGTGNSFERRKWEIEFTNYYSKDYTPEDEFGKLLFSDWDEEEWLSFDNYMISCLQLYLKKGFIKSSFTNLGLRRLIAETVEEFVDWITDEDNEAMVKVNERIRGKDLHTMFISDNSDFSNLSERVFYRWFAAYVRFKFDTDVKTGKDNQGKYFIIEQK